MIFLENENIKASFVSKGAELQSLKSKETNIEYLWNGNTDYWGKHSPVLFPIVGGLQHNTYFFKEKEYHLPRHGFARDNEFDVDQISDTEVIFTFTQNEQTLAVYPFHFVLKLHYKISGSTLSCTYEVINPDQQALLFSIGGHPAFAIPTNNEIGYSDYFLAFDKDQELVYHKIKNDLIDDKTGTIELKNGLLPLTHQLFYQDALVFKTLKSNRISIRNHKNPHGIDFQFSDFPFFGIWAAKDADFICLEPWCGIADGINHNQQFEEKEGIITLLPGIRWHNTWAVACF